MYRRGNGATAWAVERRPGMLAPRTSTCFNGATAWRLWKGAVASTEGSTSKASMGPRPQAWKVWGLAGATWRDITSMGPRLGVEGAAVIPGAAH